MPTKEAIMRTVLLICINCGHEQKIKIYGREEAERKNIRLGPPKCARCGSTNVVHPNAPGVEAPMWIYEIKKVGS
jgi:hypothetical protein